MTYLSLAKINLFLHVVSKRNDGYHNLQTIFQLLNYGDEMEFKEGGIIRTRAQEVVANSIELLEKIEKHKGKIFDSIRQRLNIKKEYRIGVLLKYIADLDGIRKTNFAETFREWHTILNKKIV